MILRLLITLILLPGLLPAREDPQAKNQSEATPPADSPRKLRELIDTLDQASLQEAFRLLTNDYINHEELDPLEINRAALEGLLGRLDFGAMLLTEKSRSARDSPFSFHHARLSDDIAYVRFGRYTESGVEEFDAALKEFSTEKEIENLIVDLRSPQAQAAFSIAAQILSRFRPPNELLFKIRRPGNDRPTLFLSKPVPGSWRNNVILLVDEETGNVGEIIAAVLKRESKPLVIGERTPGLTVEYRDVPVGENRILRYAIAEVVLEDDTSIFQKGIEPDAVTPTDQEAKHAIFRATQDGKPLADFLFRKQRPRMNEAALVAGTDPEIDYYLLRSNDKPTPWDDPPPKDRVLQQAVDLLGATSFLESGKKKRR
ncbi:MAG: S41 family peptidase [Verrucomicrobiales bacterium]